MDLKLSQTINSVKLYMMEAAHKAEHRKLSMYKENPIKCIKGCSHCCSRLPIITIAEATIIYDYLHTNKKWFDKKEEIKEQAKLANDINYIAWFKMNKKCSLLKNNLCSIYPIRPPFCSTHFVTSNPELCDPWSTAAGKFALTSMDDLLEEFSKKVDDKVDQYGIFRTSFPLPIALLIAERIQYQSKLEIHQVIRLVFNELK